MQLNWNNIGVFSAESKSWAIGATARASSVNSLPPLSRASSSPAGFTTTDKPYAYIMREAPQRYVRSVRARNISAYRAELGQSRTKDDVNQYHILQMHSLLDDVRKTDREEIGFIAKHMNLLMKEREKFMSGEQYAALSWISAPVEDANGPDVESTQDEKSESGVDSPAPADSDETDNNAIGFGAYRAALSQKPASRIHIKQPRQSRPLRAETADNILTGL
ncbi:MAG: hypothetical protein LBV27_05555 [Oscillospiraceae bacterium]|nr:hypothetical protein [Oscillospiraceae bacterium]